MTPTKLAARAVLAGVTLSALGLFLATPASAHTNDMYTLAYAEDAPYWATIDRTNGAATPLPNPVANFDDVQGAEISNEVGYALAWAGDGYVGFTWDHTTGIEGSPVPLTLAGAESIDYVSGLDTRNDGTLLTYVEYFTVEGEEPPVEHGAVATVDFATGALVPVVDLDVLLFGAATISATSLATDPLTGTTYLFIQNYIANTSFYVPLTFPGYGDLVQFEGPGFSSGAVLGADFDSDGSLYFIYANYEGGGDQVYELSRLGAPSTWATATREYRGDAAGNLGDNALSGLALTIEYTPPALAATGSEFSAAWIVAAGVAVLAGAVTVVTTRRRTA